MPKLKLIKIDTHNQFLANGRFWVIAFLDDTVVGMASITGLADEFPWMNDLFVEPDFRRQGIGRALVDARVNFIRSIGTAAGVNCGIDPKNAASIELLESFGFRHVYTNPDGTRLYSLLFDRTCQQVSKPCDVDTLSNSPDEATDLEPLDEPTEIVEQDPPRTACAGPELPAQELPAQRAQGVPSKPAGKRGPPPRHVPHEVLEETIATLRACDCNRKRATDKLGISKNAFLRRLKLAEEAGIEVPAPVLGNPKHREKRQRVEEARESKVETQPLIVPPRPRRGRPPKTRGREPGTIAEMVTDRGAVPACEDAIAAELVVMEPQSTSLLVRRTKFRESIVREALKSDRFRKTSGGYALA